ncbi:MAG: MoaD/ThiS family protein [Halioglobus sp.]
MLRVLFFARVREQLGCAELALPCSPDTGDLDSLQEFLCAERGATWRKVLTQSNMIRAVNQAVVAGNCVLHDGDEVAFYPPVTGG